MKDKYEYIGEILVRKNGLLVLHRKNLVVSTGKAYGASRLISNTEFAVLAAIGVGAGTAAPTIGDVQLASQLARQAFDSAATRNANTVSMTATFAAGTATGTISEAGLFWATGSGSGVMFSRTTFTGIPKGAADVVAVTWQITGN